MIRKLRTGDPRIIRVIFELPSCLWADHVYVVGDHNAWDTTATRMQQERDGVWRAEVDLPTGSTCAFRYLVDGRWLTDYHADGCTENEYGTQNSLVIAQLPDENLQLPRQSSHVWDNGKRVSQQIRKRAQRSWFNHRKQNHHQKSCGSASL